MAKQDKIITRVEADPTLSKKAGIFAIANGTTKAEMFIRAMEFYSEHHQHLLPENLQTSGLKHSKADSAPPAIPVTKAQPPERTPPTTHVPALPGKKASPEILPEGYKRIYPTDEEYHKAIARMEQSIISWAETYIEFKTKTPDFYINELERQRGILEELKASGNIVKMKFLTLSNFMTLEGGTYNYRLDKDCYHHLVDVEGYEPVVRFDDDIDKATLRKILSEVKGSLPDIYHDMNVRVTKMEKYNLKNFKLAYAESYELIDEE